MLAIYRIGTLTFGYIVVQSQSETKTHGAADEEEGRMAAVEKV